MTSNRWAPRVTKELLLSKHRYFVNIQLWPIEARLDPEGWLTNFTPDEEMLALTLLNSFFYYSHDLIVRLFLTTINNLSQRVLSSRRSFLRAKVEWRAFITQAYFVRVTGEQPSDSDSGYIFSRMVRQEAGIPEKHILSPEDLVSKLLTEQNIAVVFVDDFVGSGHQFINLWHRKLAPQGGPTISLDTLAHSLIRPNFFYCPLVCTSYGLEALKSRCQLVNVCPAHILDGRYNALSPESVLWPPSLRSAGQQFVENASRRAGIPDNGGGINDWRGFHKLGLTVAFEHGPPDATLPLFYWDANSWRPLVRRK